MEMWQKGMETESRGMQGQFCLWTKGYMNKRGKKEQTIIKVLEYV